MLNKRIKLAFVFFTIALPALSSLAATSQTPLSPEPLNDERQSQLIHLLKQDCGSCHGMTLKGGLGPALLPKNLKDKPDLFLQNTILMGRPGTAMPPWEGLLTEQETKWLIKQLKQGIKHEH